MTIDCFAYVDVDQSNQCWKIIETALAPPRKTKLLIIIICQGRSGVKQGINAVK